MKPNKQPDAKSVAPVITSATVWIRNFVAGVFILGGILAAWALMQTGAAGEAVLGADGTLGGLGANPAGIHEF